MSAIGRTAIRAMQIRGLCHAFLRAAREVGEHGTFEFAENAVTFGELNALMAPKSAQSNHGA